MRHGRLEGFSSCPTAADDFVDLYTFSNSEGNESVKSPAAVVSWNKKNCRLLALHGMIACHYSMVVYSLYVLSAAMYCTKVAC